MTEVSSAREIIALACASGLLSPLVGRKAELAEHHGARVLRGGPASARAACADAGIPVNSLGPWLKRDPNLKATLDFWREDLDEEGFRLKAQGRVKTAPEVPDFLTWREAHMAYLDFDGRAVRARNSWFQEDAIRQLTEHHRLLMVLPPGHLKSSLAIEFTTWNIMRNRNFRATIVQKNADEASKILGAIKARLQCDLHHEMARRLTEQGEEAVSCPVCLYGGEHGYAPDRRDRGAMWGQHAIRVTGTTSGEKDPSVQARGVGSQIMGSRADLVLCDDVQDPMDAISSPKDSTDKLTWVQTVLLSRLYRGQKFVAVGNYVTSDDLMHQLTSTYPSWPTVAYPAIRPCPDEACPGDDDCAHKEERVLAPQVWDWSSLQEKRAEVGEKAWAFTWTQTDENWEARTFRRETLEAALSDDFRLGEIPLSTTDYFLGVDPAAAASGHCAIIGWGLDRRTGQRYLLDIFNQTGMRTWDLVVDEIAEMAKRLKAAGSATFRAVIIERTNTQETLINDKRLHRIIRGMGAHVIEYRTRTGTGGRAKRDSFDISTIGGLYDAGLISLPAGGTVEENAKVDHYIDQFLAWRVDDEGRSIKHLKRDLVMATLFAESEAFTLANRPPRPPVIIRQDVPGFVHQARKRMRGDVDAARVRRQLARQRLANVEFPPILSPDEVAAPPLAGP